MGKHILAIVAIFLCTAAAWAILGTTILARTYTADSGLESRVANSWGGPQEQKPPAATSVRIIEKRVETIVEGKKIETTNKEAVTATLSLEQTRVRAGLDLEQRQKGLLWFATYRVAYSGSYVFRNTTASENVILRLAFPVPNAIYDDLVFRVNGKPVQTAATNGEVTASVTVPVNALVRVDTGYKSQGLDTWHYSFGDNVSQVRDFRLDMTTDFDEIDFPLNTLSPTVKHKTKDGWALTWTYNNLVTGNRIGMVMPEKLQPGPLAGRISYFAPVSLLFFFFLMFIIAALRRIELHPMHYFFIATSFFAFHLLLAYLVDHISIHLAFVISSAVSIFLVVSYLRVVVGPRFAFIEAGLTQLVYLVGFSYAFFFKGFTGLAVTVGAIVTLFVVMQMTARVKWSAGADPDALAGTYPAS